MIKVRLEKIIRNILVKGPFKKISMRDFPTFSYTWTSRILTLLNISKQEPINPLTWSLEKSTPSRRSLPALEVPPPPLPWELPPYFITKPGVHMIATIAGKKSSEGNDGKDRNDLK